MRGLRHTELQVPEPHLSRILPHHPPEGGRPAMGTGALQRAAQPRHHGGQRRSGIRRLLPVDARAGNHGVRPKDRGAQDRHRPLHRPHPRGTHLRPHPAGQRLRTAGGDLQGGGPGEVVHRHPAGVRIHRSGHVQPHPASPPAERGADGPERGHRPLRGSRQPVLQVLRGLRHHPRHQGPRDGQQPRRRPLHGGVILSEEVRLGAVKRTEFLAPAKFALPCSKFLTQTSVYEINLCNFSLQEQYDH